MFEEAGHLALIVEHGTFTAAARHAHLSQPALSASIRRLEDWAGARLLHRGRTGARRTAAGKAFLPRARAALGSLDEAKRAVAEVTGLEAGEVRLAAGATVTTYLMPPALAAFRQQHPLVKIVLREMTTDDVRAGVDSGVVDLGVVSSMRGAVVKGDVWERDELILVGAPGSCSADGPFVTFAPGTTTRAALDRAFPSADIVMELASIAAAKSHVSRGIGIALVSRIAVRDELASGALVEIETTRTPIPRRIVLVHRGVEQMPPSAAKLRRILLGRRGPARR